LPVSGVLSCCHQLYGTNIRGSYIIIIIIIIIIMSICSVPSTLRKLEQQIMSLHTTETFKTADKISNIEGSGEMSDRERQNK